LTYYSKYSKTHVGDPHPKQPPWPLLLDCVGDLPMTFPLLPIDFFKWWIPNTIGYHRFHYQNGHPWMIWGSSHFRETPIYHASYILNINSNVILWICYELVHHFICYVYSYPVDIFLSMILLSNESAYQLVQDFLLPQYEFWIPFGYSTVRHGIDGPFIDALPSYKMAGFSMANCECHNQRVYPIKSH